MKSLILDVDALDDNDVITVRVGDIRFVFNEVIQETKDKCNSDRWIEHENLKTKYEDLKKANSTTDDNLSKKLELIDSLVTKYYDQPNIDGRLLYHELLTILDNPKEITINTSLTGIIRDLEYKLRIANSEIASLNKHIDYTKGVLKSCENDYKERLNFQYNKHNELQEKLNDTQSLSNERYNILFEINKIINNDNVCHIRDIPGIIQSKLKSLENKYNKLWQEKEELVMEQKTLKRELEEIDNKYLKTIKDIKKLCGKARLIPNLTLNSHPLGIYNDFSKKSLSDLLNKFDEVYRS